MDYVLLRYAGFALVASIVLLIVGAFVASKYSSPRDMLRGLLFLPALVAFCAAIVMFAWSFHWIFGVVVLVAGLVNAGGVVLGRLPAPADRHREED